MLQWMEKRKSGLRRENVQVADFMFDREDWEVGKFKIVLDEAQFHHQMHGRYVDHTVGKVELCQEVEPGQEKEIGRRMDLEIKDFMEKYSWAFPYTTNVPMGPAKDWNVEKDIEQHFWGRRWQSPETILKWSLLEIQGKLRAFGSETAGVIRQLSLDDSSSGDYRNKRPWPQQLGTGIQGGQHTRTVQSACHPCLNLAGGQSVRRF